MAERRPKPQNGLTTQQPQSDVEEQPKAEPGPQPFRISSNTGPGHTYGKAGLKLTTTPIEVPRADLTQKQLQILRADPLVNID